MEALPSLREIAVADPGLGKLGAFALLLAELTQRLRAPGLIRPQGMALVVLLLTDVEQPLFGVGTGDDLARAIVHAAWRLQL
jgi:hypothetical protein